MTPKLRIAAITDEFSPDPGIALDAMEKIGMTGAELRVLWGKNIMDLIAGRAEARSRGSCAKQEHGSDLDRLAHSEMRPAERSGSRHAIPAGHLRFEAHLRRSAAPDGARFRDREALRREHHPRVFLLANGASRTNVSTRSRARSSDLADKAAKEDLIIGLENEHACNLGTAAETAPVLNAVNHPNLKLVWDPANALVAGEDPFPDGYNLIPEGPHRPRSRKGLPYGRAQAGLGAPRHAARRLERPDRCAPSGRLRRLAESRNALARPGRQ